MSLLWYPVAILALLCGSAFFSAAEMALSAANRLRLENAAEEGSRRAAWACAVCGHFDDALSAILIGNNLCNIGADSLVTLLVVLLLGEGYTWISTVLLTLVVILFCESLPKLLSKQNANRYTIAMAGVLRVLMVVLKPVVWVTVQLIRLLTLPFRGEVRESDGEEAAAELQSIIETVEDEGVIDEERGEMLQAALDFSQVPVMDVMTARVDMEALNADDSWEEILRTLSDTPYSRLPVYEENSDNIIGILYLNHFFKALLEADGGSVDIRALLLPPCYVYKTMKLPEALSVFRRNQQHLAIVTDEYGGTLGLVTLEDVLEQIVGEIWDESDVVENDVVERAEGVWELDGDLPVAELEELLELPEEALEADSATVGGWTIENFGTFPAEGDSFRCGDWKITVLSMEDGRRVDRILAERETQEEDA